MMIDAFSSLLHRHPLVFLHLVTAFSALVLGAVIMARRKGNRSHRLLGWVWVVLMGTTAVASAFIRDFHYPNIWGFTPIHAFTAMVAVGLPRGIWLIRHGNVVGHQKQMRGMFIGGCVLAGVFTLLPGRFLGTLLWKHLLGVMA